MAIGNTNPTDKVGVSAPEAGTGAKVETTPADANNVNTANNVANAVKAVDSLIITHDNDRMFLDMAALAVNPNILGEKNQALIDKSVQSRVVDISSIVPTMKSAKMNLMSNGKLLLSLNNGEELFNHAVTPKERAALADIMNNPELLDDQKLNKLSLLVSSIAVSTQMAYNFDKSLSQGDSVAMHR